MIAENIALVIKVVLLLFACYHFAKLKLSAFPVALIPIFMAGVEFITDHKYPWTYLFSSEANTDSYKKALFGGALFIVFIGMLWTWLVVDISKILQQHEESDLKN